MFVSVVICSYNRHQSLRDTLESLAAQTADRESFEVIVVDNNSADDTKETVREFEAKEAPQVRYRFEGRQGKAYALETGIREAKGDILAFTDDDVIVGPAWIENIRKAFAARRIACLGGRIQALWLCEKPKWFHESFSGVIVEYDRGERFIEIKNGVPPFGANLIVSAEALEKYGGFRRDLASATFMRCEDTELVRRFMTHGEPVYYSPDVVVLHKITAERMTKRFIRNWFYTLGMAESRLKAERKAGQDNAFTVPRSRYLNAASNLFRAVGWALIGKPAESFYFETRFWRGMGFIVGRRRVRREIEKSGMGVRSFP